MALPNSGSSSTSRPPRAATASPATWRSGGRSHGCAPWRSSGRHTRQDEEKIRRDIRRDKFLTAEGQGPGIIDEVLTMIKRGSEPAVEVVST
jgi:hypothetical protein